MNNKLLIGAVVLFLTITGIGGFLVMSQKDNPGQGMMQDQVSIGDAGVGKSSLKSLMGFVGNQQCTFSDNESGSNGTLYGGGGKIRTDFSSVSEGKTMQTHMISDGVTLHMWFDGEPSGFKVSIAEMEKFAPADGVGSGKANVDLENQVDYECQAWTVDASKFEIPSTVTFQDFNQMMQGFAPQSSDGGMMGGESVPDKSEQCGACASLPAEAKVQCELALDCN